MIFHDAVRPFIDDRIIADCVSALDDYEAVDTAIPSADTIIEVDENRHITGIPVRFDAAARPDSPGLPDLGHPPRLRDR